MDIFNQESAAFEKTEREQREERLAKEIEEDFESIK